MSNFVRYNYYEGAEPEVQGSYWFDDVVDCNICGEEAFDGVGLKEVNLELAEDMAKKMIESGFHL